MKINKLLIASALALPVAVSPLGLMTSCSNAWGRKAPLAIGAAEIDSPNNPYINFLNEDIKDIDGLSIPYYLQSNYAIDNIKSVNYAYTMYAENWYETKDGKSTKLSTDKWTDSSASWLSSANSITSSITAQKEIDGKKYQLTETCSKNVTLSANISFIATIGAYINKFISYAINYATSQVHNDADFATAWGGKTPVYEEKDKRALYEWIYANSNAHASGKSEAFLRSTNANFNFDQTFPIPAYVDSPKEETTESDKKVAPITRKLLTGDENSSLDDKASKIYYKETSTQGDGDNKYTIYSYQAVPVLIRTKNIVQRFTNPQKDNSFFVSDFYQNDKNTIVKEVGNTWSKMAEKDPSYLEPVDPAKPDGEKRVIPHFYKYDIDTTNTSKKITYAQTQESEVDARIKALNPMGNDFIAFVTYNYVKWDKPDSRYNRNNTVTLTALQTIMPAFLLSLKSDLFTKVVKDKDNSGYMVDINKADKYSNELINLLSRNSDQGRVAKASDLSKESKQYLEFLNYMFGKDNEDLKFDFVTATEFGK